MINNSQERVLVKDKALLITYREPMLARLKTPAGRVVMLFSFTSDLKEILRVVVECEAIVQCPSLVRTVWGRARVYIHGSPS